MYDAISAKHQRRCEPTTIGDATGRADERVRRPSQYQVRDLRNKCECRSLLTVTAGFRALGDDDVGSGIKSAARVVEALDLADQGDPGGPYRRRKRRRVAKG